MLSFSGDPEVKSRCVALAAARRRDDHPRDGGADYWAELGVPEDVVVLQRRLRAMLHEDAQMWPMDRIMVAIPVGRDLSGAFSRFVAWLLSDPRRGVARDLDLESPARHAVRRVAMLYSFGGPHRQWVDAGSVAEDAAARLAGPDPHAANAAWVAAWAVEHVLRSRAGEGVSELLDAAILALRIGDGFASAPATTQAESAWANAALCKLSEILSSSPRQDAASMEREDFEDDVYDEDEP